VVRTLELDYLAALVKSVKSPSMTFFILLSYMGRVVGAVFPPFAPLRIALA
jgi:hypothetical protein